MRQSHSAFLEHQRQYYWAHREKILLRAQDPEVIACKKKKRDNSRLECIGYYSKGQFKCAHCGILDLVVLCIDHINGGGEQERKRLKVTGGYRFYQWLKRNNYPKGYQVLCANCNIKKTF